MQKKNVHVNQPDWVSAAIIYQIFPDRFRRSGQVALHQSLSFLPWESEPLQKGFQGGDLYGIIENLDYLQGFGINCIYLTPIFSSAANHRYHSYDYFQVDPILGGNLALEALIEALHAREMRIVLDGVFNHCGRGFWAFHHLLENGEMSPYKDWFSIHNWPLIPYPSKGEDCGYSCWWNDPALPKFNHSNPAVCNYLLDVASFWIDKGIDGWRLDVPDEVDIDFWIKFRERIKSVNPQIWIVGEIWGDARTWLNDNIFDGVMNYRLGWSTLSWAAKNFLNRSYQNPLYPIDILDTKSLISIWETTLSWYTSEVNCSLMNLLDSHDLPRALNTLKGDISALKISLLILFLHQGAPCIYYGTETGLDGYNDPMCREPFPWEKEWNVDLRAYINSLSAFRLQFLDFVRTGLKWSSFGEDGLQGISSKKDEKSSEHKETILIWINRSRKSWLEIPTSLSKPCFLLGKFDLSSKKLAPQSAVIFSDSFC